MMGRSGKVAIRCLIIWTGICGTVTRRWEERRVGDWSSDVCSSDLAREKNLVTQMGIQVHSFYDYVLATELIRQGIVGKVKKVIAWSPKVWGYDGPELKGSDPVPDHLDWDLWQGNAKKRPYKEGFYHPDNWRKIVDYGNGPWVIWEYIFLIRPTMLLSWGYHLR